LDEAIRSATRSNTGLGQILTEGHPIRGIALAELGKLLSVDEPHLTHLVSPQSGITTSAPLSSNSSSNMLLPPSYPPSGPQRLKLAYETLKKARSELMIGFGEEAMKEARWVKPYVTKWLSLKRNLVCGRLA